MSDITDEDINHLWWTAYNANNAGTAYLCGQALGNEVLGREPDPDAWREVEQIIRREREAAKELEAEP